MNGIDSAPLSHIARDVLTDSNDTVNGTQGDRLSNTLSRSVGSKRNGDGRTHEVHYTRAPCPERDIQKKLAGIVG